ncbi:MAG TPA: response regulator, partial [Fibrobacteria bacterium]|nr:response regulator [Fibrobacteria bacterium]
MLKVLLLDRDEVFRHKVADAWDLPDSELREAPWDRNTFTLLEEVRADLVFLDAGALWQEGVDVLSWIRARRPATQVVVLSDERTRSEGRSALARGANQVLVKPLEPLDLVETARRTANSVATARNSRDLETQVLEDMLGDTPEMRKILRVAREVA